MKEKTAFPLQLAVPAEISVKDDSTVISSSYQDIYHQQENGSQEKNYVFLQGNYLPENWKNKHCFTIAETGFGLGLNFLNTLKLWSETRNDNQHLHYISCELNPLTLKQLTSALDNFSELSVLATELIKLYPSIHSLGFHRLHFNKYNCTLSLIFGDCIKVYSNLNAKIDAWYLDGFAPSKNPQMWSEKLFHAISQLSKNGTTLATYSVASAIRKGLDRHGFEIKKIKGFGKKREMLTAIFKETTIHKEKQPWAQTYPAGNTNNITVLGAGIAGITLTETFINYGENITLIDRQPQPCLETSGNPQAMIMPSFDLNDSAESRFYLNAFLYAIRHYPDKYYHSSGVLQYTFNTKQKNWKNKLFERFKLPEELIQPHSEGILYSTSGWLDTQGYARHVSAKTDNYIQAEITRIEYKDNIWYLYSDESLVNTCQTLVLANGINLIKLLQNSGIDYQLPLTAKHGQISYFKSAATDVKISENPHIQLSDGYITPQWNGEQTLGATFDHLPRDILFEIPQTEEGHWQRNIELWKDSEYFSILKNTKNHKSRAGIRVTTPDHMPVCGAVINQQKFIKDYADIHHGRHWKQYPKPQPLGNLYLMTGLGSRGFTSAPLLAEFLCNQILGQPHALDLQMQKSIHPSRFLYKSLKKR